MTNDTTPPEPESAQAKKTRLEIARKKAAEANALLQKLEALAKTRESSNRRKLDTRRKTLLGAYLLSKIKKDDDEKARVWAGLDKFLSRPAERALFDLPPLAPTPAEAQSSGPAFQEQPPALPASTGGNAPPVQSRV